MFQTSVTFIIFNRPVHTKKTFEIIRKIKPPKLFIIADGPRPNFPEDKTLFLTLPRTPPTYIMLKSTPTT